MAKRIISILLVTLSIALTLTACKVGGKTMTVTMEELWNTDLSQVIMPDSILTNPDYCSQKDEFMFIERAVEPIGYRGRDFQRYYIHYDSVRFMGNGAYTVEGRTRYRDTIRLFSGTITLDSMRLDKGKHLSSTGKFGKLCGHYQFDEDEFSGGGVLTGKMTIYFTKVNGRFYYDAFKLGLADGYDNRQYEGVWTSKNLTCLENYKRNTLPFSTNTASSCPNDGIRRLNGGRKRYARNRDAMRYVSAFFPCKSAGST